MTWLILYAIPRLLLEFCYETCCVNLLVGKKLTFVFVLVSIR